MRRSTRNLSSRTIHNLLLLTTVRGRSSCRSQRASLLLAAYRYVLLFATGRGERAAAALVGPPHFYKLLPATWQLANWGSGPRTLHPQLCLRVTVTAGGAHIPG